MGGFKVGETYSLNEVSAIAADGFALVSTDRIVTREMAWQRMTVERLQLWLAEALEAKEITPDTEIWVDSDPEGNGLHPMRAAATLLPLTLDVGGERTIPDEDAETVELPAKAVWFGVGY